jgi:5-methylcytosine-specific restriction enzyme A
MQSAVKLKKSRKSPPGVRRGGFCLSESLVPVKPPVHRPSGAKSAAAVKAELDRLRPSASTRGYGARWRRARLAFLARHPLCASCQAEGRVVHASVVDHVVPHRGNHDLFWDQRNWAPACKHCHDRKTAREGRWG